MTRTEIKSEKSTTYTYNVAGLQKKDVLASVCDILEGKDVVGFGLILTEPLEEKDWPGTTREIPFNPGGEAFAKEYENVPLTCVTAIMQYKKQTMMVSYLPQDSLLSVILPAEFESDIDEVEKNVIPDIIDQNPAE